MRIGLYHEAAGSRDAGGVARFVQDIGAALAETHDVTLYTGPGEPTETVAESAVRVVRIPTLPGEDRLVEATDRHTRLGTQSVRKVATFASAWRSGVLADVERNCDVLFTHQYLDDLLLSRVVDVPTVFEYHGLQSVGAGTRARERLSATRHVLANSGFTARSVADALGREVGGILRPGVDVERFSPQAMTAPDGGASAEANGGIPPFDGIDDERPIACDDERPIVLFVGRLVPAKGIADLLAAASRLTTDARFVVAGRGDADRWKSLAADLGVVDAVTFVGTVAHDDLPRYYRACDVFCNPTHYESFCMTNLEAMACGTPVVTTPVGGIRSYATDGETASLVAPGRPDELASALDDLLGDPSERARLGAAARDVSTDHDWSERAATAARLLQRARE